MLPTDLLENRRRGEELIPRRLPLDAAHRALAREAIALFADRVGRPRRELEEARRELEGEATDYRLKRGLLHLLERSAATFETVAPLDPPELRRRAFDLAAARAPSPAAADAARAELASALSRELEREVTTAEVDAGLYADLKENEVLVAFDPPEPDALLHRWNLAQVQGVLYRAREITLTAHRNDPGEYKQLVRYLKLFGLIAWIEGDPDTGFTIILDGPASLFGPSTRYGVDLAKFLPALLHVTRWEMSAAIAPRRGSAADGDLRLSLDSECGLVSHYKKGATFDSAVERSLAERWASLDTPWRLEREVELVPLGDGGVMVPDFRLVHPDGRAFLLEIVGYWRPAYLRKKFRQVARSGREDLVLAVSERLDLDKAGVKPESSGARIVWFKGKVDPREVLRAVEAPPPEG